MEPSRQESVSRQSSILKAPKQRQPLQIVATNPSSSESSPTIKIKRRVSFAKNKRIREFCNEVEPKEGLDDSYEEHDLSSTKSSSGNCTDQPLVISVACEDKENFPIQLFLPTDEFECKEIQPVPPCVEGDNLSQCEMEMDNSINTSQSANDEMQTKETTLPNATIYFDDGMDITASIQPQIISEHVGEDNYYNDTVPVSQTCIEDIPMEMTENLQSILSKKLVHAQNTNHNVDFENNTLNFTEPVSAILGIGNVKKLLESQHAKTTRNCENETECFTDAPLEFTSVIPSSTWIRPHNQSQDNDETEKFNYKTIEFTEVAQIHDIICKNKTEGTVNTSDEVIKALLAQKDSKISDEYLKQTQHNEVCQEKNNIPSNNSIATTKASSNQIIVNQTSNVIQSSLRKMQDKTTIFPNASMEMTEAVPVYNEKKTLPLSRTGTQEEIPKEKKKISIDASMQMTEMIASQNKLGELTSFTNKVLEVDTSKTQAFFNTSMEMTEAVPNSQKINHPNEFLKKCHPKNMQDKIKLFNDNSMEMTEAVGFSRIQRFNNCKNQSMVPEQENTRLFEAAEKTPSTNIPDKTKVFNDNSMEMTEALGFNHCKNQLMVPENKIARKSGSIPYKTKVFNDNSMEMTETLGINHCKNLSMAPENEIARKTQSGSVSDKTKVFYDNSMEMTEALGFNHCKNQLMVPENEITRKTQSLSVPDKTKVPNDNSMEMTEALGFNHCKNQLMVPENKFVKKSGSIPDKTKVFNDNSMEITEALGINRCKNLSMAPENEIARKTQSRSVPDKTKVPNDNSMEMTEALGFNHCKNQLMVPENEIVRQSGSIPDKTKVFNDNSMEMTEALGINHCKNLLMAPENEIARKTQPGNIPDKTKVFYDNSMEMTEALGFNHCENQLMVPENEIARKTQSGSIPDKTKVFNDNSMEMTEALGINHCKNLLMAPENEIARKTQPENIPDKTKVFYDNSMEMTEALGFNEIKKSNHCKNLLMAPGNEKTQLYFNTSMEITEAVPISNKNNSSAPTTNNSHHEVTQERTKVFNDKSMKVTEAVLHYNKFDTNQISGPRQEKTKIFFNTSMEITDTPILQNKINQPFADARKTHEDVTLKKTEFFCNKSMEITEAVSAYHHIHQCTGKNQQEDRTKIVQNKSMEVTETVLNYNKSGLLCSSKNQLAEIGQEPTKFFCNASMEITEAVPMISRAHELGSELKNTFCRNFPEKTEIFQNRSMEMTEAVKNSCGKNYNFEKSEINDRVQEKTRVFPNTSVTETIPVNKEIWKCNVENGRNTLWQSKNLNQNLGIPDINSDNKTINVLRDDETEYFNNKSMDFTENLPVLDHQNVSNYVQNAAPNLITDKTKHFYNNSMDVTEAVMKNQNSICANPSIVSNSLKDSERMHQYNTTLPNEINVPNLDHSNGKKDNAFNRSSYRDKSFQRMTTDELHTLCASMNLPTQNYTTERTATLQNDYISICNDVNVLRDSLKKNSMFQQNFTIGTGISIAMDNNMLNSTNVTENSKKQDDLQIFCNTNSDSVERTVTTRKEEFEIIPAGIESQKEYNTSDKHVSGEKNFRISEMKSMESDIRNSRNQDVFSISNKSHKNTTIGSDTEYSESNILNDKQKNNIHSPDKSETLQMHSVSATLSTNRKSSTKRKSAEMDEHFEITENSLKRLPSDNTDFLIATMGIRSELSHPLVINNRTTIKVPCAPLENDGHALSFCSNESIRPEENVSRGEHDKSSKTITTSMIEDEVFHDECISLNKENKIPGNKESSGKIESFSENSMNQIDEIQPPSFLCSDSFQTDSWNDAEMLDDKSSDAISSKIIQEPVNVTSEKQYCTGNSDSSNSKNSSTRETRQSLENDVSLSTNVHRVDLTKNLNENSSEPVNKLAFFNNSKNFNESAISLINEEDLNTDPLAPFMALTKSIEICEKRDDCIWTIRKIDQKTVAVDFISKSFVTIIRLNEIEKACIKDIDNIEFISRLYSGTKNILLKIVHRLLLSKLKPDKLLSEFKMYEDVLPLLDCISNEVILAMNFMFDLERLSSLYLLSVESERIMFMVSSKKANIILKISLMLKVFNEIGPDDVTVTCVLGDVRIKDIKQLIVNIKKDSSFLSRYIKNVKDYIILMEESTHVQR